MHSAKLTIAMITWASICAAQGTFDAAALCRDAFCHTQAANLVAPVCEVVRPSPEADESRSPLIDCCADGIDTPILLQHGLPLAGNQALPAQIDHTLQSRHIRLQV